MPPQSNSSSTNPIHREPWFESYPTGRDLNIHLKSSFSWLKGKVEDDNLGGPYWRIHNKLYDLTDFAKHHPGGKQWIELTKGTDITEAFESSHISGKAELMLKKYYIKDIHTPRNSPYTFHENGFYKTLKSKIRPIISKIGSGPSLKMLLMQDLVLVLTLCFMAASAWYNSYKMALIAGIFLDFTTAMAHNFFHQKDNFRMYYFDLSLFSSTDWRVSHVLSHHLFTNTLMDFEISGLEPFVYFLPDPKKTIFYRFGSYAYHLLLYALILHLEFIKRIIRISSGNCKAEWRNFLPILELVFMSYINGSFWNALCLLVVIQMTASFLFGYIGLIAAHHHPDIYHAGDQFRKDADWGLCQMDAVRDRKEVTGSLFLVTTSFGDHTLHHLFPTVDHSKLPYLYPVFFETCKEFNIPFEFISQMYLIKGKYAQFSNIKPNCNEPGYKNKTD